MMKLRRHIHAMLAALAVTMGTLAAFGQSVSESVAPVDDPRVRALVEDFGDSLDPRTAFEPIEAVDLRTLEARVVELLPKIAAATVHVQIPFAAGGIGGVNGSGVVVKDNIVLTAAHVSELPGREVNITFPDGRKATGVTLGRLSFDLQTVPRLADAGLIRITDEGDWPAVEMGRSADLQAGQWCVALGYPGGLDEKRGPVLRLGRVSLNWPDRIRTDCTILGGDSGGPLFDLEGRVIGIHSRIARPTAVNFHTPIDAFYEHWDEMLVGKVVYPRMAFLGVDARKHGLGFLVAEVQPGSPAENAGLAADDIIIAFDRTDLAPIPLFENALGFYKPGDEVKIIVLRSKKRITLNVKFGERGDPAGKDPQSQTRLEP